MSWEPKPVNVPQYWIQHRASQIRMAEYRAYAESIGCTIHGDEIECNAEQSKLLVAWLTNTQESGE